MTSINTILTHLYNSDIGLDDLPFEQQVNVAQKDGDCVAATFGNRFTHVAGHEK
jgi:hypothetical protein